MGWLRALRPTHTSSCIVSWPMPPGTARPPATSASSSSRPRVEAVEIEILAPDQIADVLAKLEGHALHPIVSLALATGMRRGELLGLQWGDVEGY